VIDHESLPMQLLGHPSVSISRELQRDPLYGISQFDIGFCLRSPEVSTRMSARAAVWARERFGIEAVAGSLRGILAEDSRSNGHASGRPDRLPAYEPSDFAGRYEEHKRACGWHVSDAGVAWFPTMFGGRDYELYETLMEPYAARIATNLSPLDIEGGWAPYCPSTVRMDLVRLIAQDLDPVWPHQRFLQPIEWEILQRVDSTRSVRQIIETTVADVPNLHSTAIVQVLWRLHVEGFVLFLQD